MNIIRKLIIDTDLGDDIDDAFALYFAIKEKKHHMLGITTVYENTNLRARMAKKLVKLMNEDIPVYAGYGKPLKGEHFQSKERIFCQYTEDIMNDEFKPMNNNESSDGEEAIDFIINSAEKYQKDLTLLCIGPLTNLAKAVQKNPQSMSKVGTVVIMGGSFYNQYREWNIVCDVEAANIVFNFGFNLHAIGFDVTQYTCVSKKVHEMLLKTKKEGCLGYFLDVFRLWDKSYQRELVLHDLLTYYYLDHKHLFSTERIPVFIETEGTFGKGITFNLNLLLAPHAYKSKASLVTCAKDVKYKQFMDDVEHRLIKLLEE